MYTDRIIAFIILSIPVAVISWRSIFNIESHGFYRFFSWECIIWLLISNIRYWFDDPLSLNQLISWALLLFSVYLIFTGVLLMAKKGNSGKSREDKNLFQFEKTTELIDSGIFRYIRHPLYSSLIFLTWGIYFKNTSVELLIVSALSTLLLYFTSIFDEKECIIYFGDKYTEYMKRSKRFIPFVI